MAHEWRYTKFSIKDQPQQTKAKGVCLVIDTGLSGTPVIGHLGCLESHWSVPVGIRLIF